MSLVDPLAYQRFALVFLGALILSGVLLALAAALQPGSGDSAARDVQRREQSRRSTRPGSARESFGPGGAQPAPGAPSRPDATPRRSA